MSPPCSHWLGRPVAGGTFYRRAEWAGKERGILSLEFNTESEAPGAQMFGDVI